MSTISETKKTAKKVQELAEKSGRFISDITGGGLRELGEGFHDWASYFRMRNLISIQDKVEEIINERQHQGKSTPIPPRLAISLVNEASLEDSSVVQDLWAHLIANAMNPESSIQVHPAFVNVVKQLEPDEATIINSPDYP